MMDWKKYERDEWIIKGLMILSLAVCWILCFTAVIWVVYGVWEWVCFGGEPQLFDWTLTLGCVGWALKTMLTTRVE